MWKYDKKYAHLMNNRPIIWHLGHVWQKFEGIFEPSWPIEPTL